MCCRPAATSLSALSRVSTTSEVSWPCTTNAQRNTLRLTVQAVLQKLGSSSHTHGAGHIDVLDATLALLGGSEASQVNVFRDILIKTFELDATLSKQGDVSDTTAHTPTSVKSLRQCRQALRQIVDVAPASIEAMSTDVLGAILERAKKVLADAQKLDDKVYEKDIATSTKVLSERMDSLRSTAGGCKGQLVWSRDLASSSTMDQVLAAASTTIIEHAEAIRGFPGMFEKLKEAKTSDEQLRRARGEVNMPNDHSDADLICTRALVTHAELELVDAIMTEKNKLELRNRVQKPIRALRAAGIKEKEVLVRALYQRALDALNTK